MRFIHYVTGIMILTLGCSLTIQSDIGTSPFDALLVGLTTQVGLTVGSWEVIIAAIMIVFHALLNKQRPEVLGLMTAFITGIGIDLWLFLLQPLIQPEHLLTKLFCVLVGLTVLGLGTAIYLFANFAPIPVDRSMLIIQDLTGMNILYSKTLIYLFFLGMALAFSGPIGIGTLLTVCLGGPILNYFSPLIRNRLSTLSPSTNDKGKNHSL